MLAIAHRISNDNGEAFPSVATIGREANLSERSVHYSLRSLESLGELQISLNSSRFGTNTYKFPLFLAWVQSLHPVQSKRRGVQSTPKTVSQIAPEPSLEPSLNHHKPRAQTRSARDRFDDEMEQRRRLEAKALRESKEEEVRRELAVG